MAVSLGGRAARRLRLLLSALKPGIQVPRVRPVAAFGYSSNNLRKPNSPPEDRCFPVQSGDTLPEGKRQCLPLEPAPASVQQSRSSVTSAKAAVNGVHLHYLRTGDGERAILLLPGMLGSGETDFGPQIENLNKKLFTVVAWDPRGYGHSRPPDRDFPVDFFERDAKDAIDLMKTLNFKKVSLLGWSDGGITALIAAARYPSYVSKMVIWGANAYVTEQDSEIYQGIRDVSKWSERTRKPLEALYGFDYFARTCEKWVDGIEQFKHLPDGSICRDLLPLVQCPTLIVHGEKDPLVPRFHADFLHRHVRGSRLKHVHIRGEPVPQNHRGAGSAHRPQARWQA
ncbi:valacyclovir hydrolase isoform X1 [Cervus elaphus]|uniref:valacyclovir hydrolase isoform X1 n=1 Tax=Cervus elaphus TaxID=9860 RepID=UPI0018B9F2E3|nr:valacyclovir hydrolase isoform X1 [Cervus elaphus]